jgi:PAS domain S-box-containing protein/putative nucleotidyltransferase with HDIG domain
VQTLKDSELRYRRLFEASQDGILILDARTGMIEDVNPYLIKMLGYSHAEFIKKKIWELRAFQDIEASQDAFKILQENEYIRYEDLPLKTKDGRLIQVEFISNVYLAGNEKVIQCNIRENTEHKRIVAALQANEKKYYDLINQSPDGYFIIELSGNILIVNNAMCKELEFSEEEFLSMSIWDIIPEQYLDQYKERLTRILRGESLKEAAEYMVRGKTGRQHYVEVLSAPRYAGGDIIGFQGVARDITARKRAEEALFESEQRFKNAFQYSAIGMALVSLEGKWLKVNSTLCSIVGYSEEELLTKTFQDITHPDDLNSDLNYLNQLLAGEIASYKMEKRYFHRDGRIVWVLLAVALAKDNTGAPLYLISQIEDITEHKLADAALRKSEDRFRAWIENSSDLVTVVGADGSIQYASPSYGYQLGYKPEDLTGVNVFDLIHPDDREHIMEIFGENIQKPDSAANAEFRIRHHDGSWQVFEGVGKTYLDEHGQVVGLISSRNITERNRAEEALRASESKFRSYNEYAPLGVFVVDQYGRYIEVNAAAHQMLGYTEFELLQLSIPDVLAPQSLEAGLQQFQTVVQDGSASAEFLFRRKDGTQFWANVIAVRLSENRFMSYCEDISERMQADKELRGTRRFLQSVQDALSAHLAILDDEGTIVQVNSTWRDFGIQNGLKHSDHCIGMNYLDVCDSAQGVHAEAASLVANAIRELLKGGNDEIRVEYPCHAPGQQRWFTARITSFENNDRMWIAVAHMDITERKLAEAKIQRQLEHLTALSAIDRVIAANFDLKLSLSEILAHVTKELGVDAADILVLNPDSNMLEYGSARGFRTRAVRKAEVRLGESYAGRVALERQLVQIPDLGNEPENPLLTTHLAGEDFACYYGVPLITKGQVKGVLEVFNRIALAPDGEWFDFLETLAGQAAIALENSTLFESLQNSNVELSLAYDATIEGWSRALDLRDKETEGHTQRVTTMTVKLARAFGFSKSELVQVRWGGLLHDIGKMGVPDGILLKPGPLTEEEWVVMKKHPTFAYEMLSPIRYLRLALDIPNSHHEKWDGSGYPHGLKGTQIPLVARIFAVVDVWDALSSDRPYRSAWTQEKVRDHIRDGSGTHFDPQVVDLFMQLIT